MLWLTSSTSPGQVQELDELARELHRGKPLLPVVTRSDVIEEDEVDGEIVKQRDGEQPIQRPAAVSSPNTGLPPPTIPRPMFKPQ